MLFRKDNRAELLANILAKENNREELLGIKEALVPTPEGIRIDATKIKAYTDSDGYKRFADNAWSQIVFSLDKILDPKTSRDQRDFYCGEVNATLNLLRLSYQALEVIKQFDKQQEVSPEPLPRRISRA